MSIRFIIGRAGSGKSHRCLEAIRRRLREDAASDHKLLLLVPEQGSFQMERALIETPDIPGFTRCEVLSFQRLAHRIFSETGTDPRRADQTIGPLGRLMAIRRLIRRERDQLRLLKAVADKPGLVKQVATAIDELIRERIQPEQLAEVAERLEATDPMQAARIADLVRLYRAYLDYLIDDRLDPAQYLSLAAQRLPACASLAGAEVWVDGFAGFTAQEYHLLVELARHVAEMEITLLADPATACADLAQARDSDTLFARTERTLVRLQREFTAAGLPVAEPVRLTQTHFDAAELARFEQGLFHAAPPTPAPPAHILTVTELPDPREEVAAAVAEIQRLTREAVPPMRYRDIAIIVRDLGPYHDLISAEMASAGIPCFIDRRQPTTHHPLVELVRGLLAIAADNCRLDSVRLLLKTGLIPLEPAEADLLENYLLASGINGRDSWRQPWCSRRYFGRDADRESLADIHARILDGINKLRCRWLGPIGPWLEFAASESLAGGSTGQPPSGRAWVEALFACLEALGVAARLAEWAEQAEADGRAHEAAAHRQVWADFVELVDEFVKALGSEAMTVTELRETIEAGLAEFTLGLAPPTLDQVLVGAIERSRHPNVRAALILGFDESHFPMRRIEDPLLGDSERESLESAGLEIGPSRRRQLLDERLLAYVALTRAGQRVWISYPRNSADGKPLQPSPYLAEVLSVFSGWSVHKPPDPRIARQPVGFSSPAGLAASLATEFRRRPVLAEETFPAARALWNGLYQAAREHECWRLTLQRSLAGLGYRNTARLDAGLMSQAVDSPFVASVSRLERFAACPFAHFVDYTLDLQERVQADLDVAEVGTVCHSVLERLVKDLVDAGRGLASLEDDEIIERIDSIAGELGPRMGDILMLTEPRNAYLFDRARGHLQRVSRWQRNSARAGRCRPQAVEFGFGFGPDATVKLVTPGGRTIFLRGRIDRVDVAELGEELVGTVIDYKRTTDRRLDLAEVYHGLALQLVGYLLAIQQCGESLAGRPIQPVAAFYLPLLEPYGSVKHPSEEKPTTYLWRGLMDTSAMQVLDGNLGPGGTSQFYSARIKNDGTPHTRCDLVRPEDLNAVMNHVARRMGELADRLLDGEIDIRPYRLRRHMPCSYCKYRPVCRYEIDSQPPNSLEALSRPEALQRITAAGGDNA